MLHHGVRSVWRIDWLDGLDSQTVTHKCDNEQVILALAQEIRRLRRENRITILEHLEEGEMQRWLWAARTS